MFNSLFIPFQASLCSELHGELTLALRCCHSSRDEGPPPGGHIHNQTSPSSTYVPVLSHADVPVAGVSGTGTRTNFNPSSGAQQIVHQPLQHVQQPNIPMYEMRKSSFEFSS